MPSFTIRPPSDCDDAADVQLGYDGPHQGRKRSRRRMNGCQFDTGVDTQSDDEGQEPSSPSSPSSPSTPSSPSAPSSADTASSGSSSSSSTRNKKRPHLSESDVASRCFARGNHIYYFSGVSKDSVYRLKGCVQKLNDQYRETKRKNPELHITPKPIYLHINSFGGGVFAAFAAIDFIKQSEIPIHTIIEGASASAATLMSVVGVRRYIRPHASMLIHQLSSWFGGKLTELEDDYKNVKQMHETIKTIYKEHTKLTETELEDILKHDLWWKAEKCLEVGVVDAIWEGGDME